jgi:hypothetical protein
MQFDIFVHGVKQLACENGKLLNVRGFCTSLSCVSAWYVGSDCAGLLQHLSLIIFDLLLLIGLLLSAVIRLNK